MADFYMTLPSNASMDVFPNNLVTHYFTKLPHPIDLEGQWEVGLVSMSYPHNHYNIRRDEASIVCVKNTLPYSFFLRSGYYHSLKALEVAIEGMTKMATLKFFHLEIDDITRKTTIIVERKDTEVILGKVLARILGFGEQVTFTHGIYLSPMQVDLNRGFNYIFVYSDIVESSVVGNTSAPLLRIFPISGKSGDLITKEVQNIHYKPVQKSQFDTIEILLKNENGENIPFEGGKSVVTLHFRKRRI